MATAASSISTCYSKPNNNSNTLVALADPDAAYKTDYGSLVRENDLNNVKKWNMWVQKFTIKEVAEQRLKDREEQLKKKEELEIINANTALYFKFKLQCNGMLDDIITEKFPYLCIFCSPDKGCVWQQQKIWSLKE